MDAIVEHVRRYRVLKRYVQPGAEEVASEELLVLPFAVLGADILPISAYLYPVLLSRTARRRTTDAALSHRAKESELYEFK